jgi:hypothetical protein
LGSALWATWVVLLYTSCVPKGALRFFNEISITYQKKKKVFVRVTQDLVPKNVLPDDFIQAIKYSDYSSISSLYDFIYH